MIDALKLEPTDTLGRWMAHYLAERLDAAERADAANKERLQREAFDVTLQLWKHRGNWPGHGRPFRETDELADKLRRFIDPSPWYFSRDAERPDPHAADWMDRAQGIDRAARHLVRWCIDKALAETSGRDAEWAEDPLALQLDDGADARITRVLFNGIRGISQQEQPHSGIKLVQMRDDLSALMDLTETLQGELDRRISGAAGANEG